MYMGLQFKNNNGSSRNSDSSTSYQNTSGTAGVGKGTDTTSAKDALAQKQEELRKKALAFEQRDAAKRQREQRMREEEEIRNNPQLAAERERRLAEMREDEERRARFKAEEEAKIEAERRVQEKRMDQTEALIAAIRAQFKGKACTEDCTKRSGSFSNSKQRRTFF